MEHLSKKILRFIKNAVFPGKCLSCGHLFVRNNNEIDLDINLQTNKILNQDGKNIFTALMHEHLCTNCIKNYTPVKSPVCIKCGMMFKERVSEDHLCGKCIKDPGIIRIARSAGIYDQSLLSTIKAFKYGKKIQLARPLGTILFYLFKNTYQDNNYPDLIIPVPLHKKRFRQRKFNQAWIVLKEWQKLAKITETQGKFELKNKILLRQKWTKPQTGLDKKKRKTNIKGAFCLELSANIKDKKILLIDDVYTTGATVNECAKVLIKGGASQVDVLTIARTQAG